MDAATPNERIAELFKRSAETGEIVTREQIVEAAGSQSGAMAVRETFWTSWVSKLSGSAVTGGKASVSRSRRARLQTDDRQ
jgi:hypothetical protein